MNVKEMYQIWNLQTTGQDACAMMPSKYIAPFETKEEAVEKLRLIKTDPQKKDFLFTVIKVYL